MPQCPSSLNPMPFVDLLCEAFTTHFVIFVSIVYFAIKGFANRAITAIQLPYYQSFLRTGSDDYQKYYNVSFMAFAVKPLIGAVSDNFPIFGYQKRYYLVLVSILGAGALSVSTLLAGEASNGPYAAMLFFIVMLAIAALDLLCEGKYSELMEKRKETGSSIISWIWGCYMLGGIIASAVEGPLADESDPRIVLYITAPFFLIPIVPALLGWLPEKKKKKSDQSASQVTDESALLHDASSASSTRQDAAVPPPDGACIALLSQYAMFSTQKQRISSLSIFASFAAIGLAVVSLYGTNMQLLIFICPTVVVMIALSFLVLPRIIACANLFMFLKELLYLQMNGPLDYFYTDKQNCIPDSPHFSYTYYQTFGNIATNVGGMIGVFVFQRYLAAGRFRSVFWITTFVKVFASFFDVIIILRWNRDYLGIDDHVMYMSGDAIIAQLAYMLDFMPASVLVSRMCPRGMESTMFALLAGMSNFGQTLSRSVGVLVQEWMDIRTSPPCKTDNLYLLVMLGHMVLPLAILPLSVYLVPNTFMKEPIKEVVTAAGEVEGDDPTRDEVDEEGAASQEAEEEDEEGSGGHRGGGGDLLYGAVDASGAPRSSAISEREQQGMRRRSSGGSRSSRQSTAQFLDCEETRQSQVRLARASMNSALM